MINGFHTLIYSADPAADRAFLRDVLGFPYVEDLDSAPGWLIFKLPPAEVGVHPTDGPPTAELHFMCDDIDATIAELAAKGAQITGPVVDARYGRVTAIRLPGGGTIGLYQPRHPIAYDL